MTGRTGTRGPSHDGCARPAQGGPGTVSGTAVPVRSPRLSVAPALVPPAQDRGMDMAAEWPVEDFLELGALPGAVPSARLHTRQILWEWAVRRKLHLMRIGDSVRAWRLPGAKTQCDLAVQRRECVRRG
jgi:hypothetical protein